MMISRSRDIVNNIKKSIKNFKYKNKSRTRLIKKFLHDLFIKNRGQIAGVKTRKFNLLKEKFNNFVGYLL